MKAARFAKAALLSFVLGASFVAGASFGARAARPPTAALEPSEDAWRDSGRGGIRGITIGPIESALHPGKGYGSEACGRAMREVRRMGATWVSLTPFGRIFDLTSTGVDPTFEAPFDENRRAVARAIEQAHAEGLRVLLVPHLWVETGAWRGELDPGDDAAWKKWAAAYRKFLLAWAKVASAAGVEMLSVGVELRSWVTTERAPLFADVVHDVRRVYSGLLTYGANWDDVERTVILGDIDVIGINAFFPLSERPGAGARELREGGLRVAERVRAVARTWHKPVVFTEIGYTTRPDPAFEPWIWPDTMSGVRADQRAQAEAYTALIAPLIDEPWFSGFFVWRVYADPDDMSQEAEWGFSPRGKLAGLVVRDAFAARWAADGPDPVTPVLGVTRAERIAP
jgi:hypothetical protein